MLKKKSETQSKEKDKNETNILCNEWEIKNKGVQAECQGNRMKETITPKESKNWKSKDKN